MVRTLRDSTPTPRTADFEKARIHSDVAPGRYVCLSVTDVGTKEHSMRTGL